MRDQSILVTGFIINAPTITNAGAVAILGTTDSKGDKNMKGKNKKAAITAVRPVRPPCSIPTADSM